MQGSDIPPVTTYHYLHAFLEGWIPDNVQPVKEAEEEHPVVIESGALANDFPTIDLGKPMISVEDRPVDALYPTRKQQVLLLQIEIILTIVANIIIASIGACVADKLHDDVTKLSIIYALAIVALLSSLLNMIRSLLLVFLAIGANETKFRLPERFYTTHLILTLVIICLSIALAGICWAASYVANYKIEAILIMLTTIIGILLVPLISAVVVFTEIMQRRAARTIYNN
jgi:hypothetical protein